MFDILRIELQAQDRDKENSEIKIINEPVSFKHSNCVSSIDLLSIWTFDKKFVVPEGHKWLILSEIWLLKYSCQEKLLKSIHNWTRQHYNCVRFIICKRLSVMTKDDF